MFPYAVAFKIYDLNNTGVIEKDEVKRLLIQLLQDNPAIDLTDDEVDTIVEQVLLQHLLSCHSHKELGHQHELFAVSDTAHTTKAARNLAASHWVGLGSGTTKSCRTTFCLECTHAACASQKSGELYV